MPRKSKPLSVATANHARKTMDYTKMREFARRLEGNREHDLADQCAREANEMEAAMMIVLARTRLDSALDLNIGSRDFWHTMNEVTMLVQSAKNAAKREWRD